jgi:alkylation response protein AidB-like acyl-CoA dehydrogenase
VANLHIARAAERARAIADEVLFPAAQDTDTAPLVPRSHLDLLGSEGLHGLFGPPGIGLGADAATARPIQEAVAGGCGATAFVWAQHHGAVRRIAQGDGPARDRWLGRCCGGDLLAGIAFAYLRRPGPAAVRATRDGGGWRLDGRAPWVTGWGLIDVLVVAARTDDDRVVTVVLDRLDHVALEPGAPQRLLAMSATGTVGLGFDGVRVGADDVAEVLPFAWWFERDQKGGAHPPAAPLGISDRALRLLAERPDAGETASVLAAELDARRTDADRLAAALREGVTGAVARGFAERDRGTALARRATDALIAASGGAAMDLAHPAQRLSREATFYLIQAQTRELRLLALRRALDPR